MISITKIAAFRIPEQVQPEDYEFFLGKVAPQRRERVKRFMFIQDSYRSLFGEVLVRAILCRDYGYTNSDIQFEHNEYGKPHVAGNNEFSYNISHSGCWVIMIWGQGLLGIDVEQVKQIDLSIANRFFSVEETESLMRKKEGERQNYFYTLWTLKESYIKAAGKGLSIPLDSFSIVEDGKGKFVLHSDKEPVCFHTFELDHGYKVAACSHSNTISPSMTFVTMNEMRTWIR